MKNCIPNLIRWMLITLERSRVDIDWSVLCNARGQITGMIVTLLKRMKDRVKKNVFGVGKLESLTREIEW